MITKFSIFMCYTRLAWVCMRAWVYPSNWIPREKTESQNNHHTLGIKKSIWCDYAMGLWEVGTYTRNTNAIFQVKNVFSFHPFSSVNIFSEKPSGEKWKFWILLSLLRVLRSHYKLTKQWHMNNQPLSLPLLPLAQLVLHSKSILKLCWTLGMVKKHIFLISLHSSALILLTFHLFFYCSGWKQWKKLLCIAIWQ